MAERIFLYGTLRYLPLLETVLGRAADAVPARLRDHRAMAVRSETYPAIRPAPGAVAEGILLTPSEEDLARLNFYEGAYHYDLRALSVETADGAVTAEVYFPTDAQPPPDGPWDYEGWAAVHGPATRIAAEEVMGLYGTRSEEEVRGVYPTILLRAWSELRARGEVPPAQVRRGIGAGEVEVLSRRMPHLGYFGVSDTVLRHPVAGGGLGPEIRREGFLMGDAVTVLPYDPVRDVVLVIDQFRFGPFLRGDPRPWSLEPVAGRVDPGETPEETARREAREEAGLEIGALHLIGKYYPSPAAVTEWLVSYVGIADLPPGAAKIGGLDSEAEDIQGHIVPLDEMDALAESGEVGTGPLLLSVHWLMRHRARLRSLA
ncbi:NUDIX domain-containing protein [Ovoidimarina sediminis]|uniref:NUDIX domain-containing protein n=1 Tax=Ovoidimarina sediminis TaxID=3079856 RepID=UPI0029074A8D|nr:NUDIX domain-containing protein [Rhodophyticola sp. MJ-SS7]MDU8944356.1 NUDIX domain-containing protein [Rhodophyticola sp. MJ-SS7]